MRALVVAHPGPISGRLPGFSELSGPAPRLDALVPRLAASVPIRTAVVPFSLGAGDRALGQAVRGEVRGAAVLAMRG